MKTPLTLTNLPDGRIEIKGTFSWEELSIHKTESLAAFASDITIDGFRAGKAPLDIVEKKVGEMPLLEEMAHRAISLAFIDAIKEQKIDAIGKPEVNLTKLGIGSDLEFTLITAVMPTINLPDATAIAKEVFSEKIDCEVSEKELQDSLDTVRKMAYQSSLPQEKDGVALELPKLEAIKLEETLELTNDSVKLFGDFNNLEHFTNALKHNLSHEKTHHAFNKKQAEFLDTLVEKADIQTPKILVDYELDRIIAEFTYELSLSGVKFEDYAKQMGKSIDDMKAEFSPQAKKQADLHMILMELSKKHAISANPEVVAEEVNKAKAQFGNLKDFDEERAKNYFEGIELNKAVIGHFIEAYYPTCDDESHEHAHTH
jgi:FKBP-type peptidyl-prolyl cis-trans isomerase (trigger factor)